jgi:hypothetical protein
VKSKRLRWPGYAEDVKEKEWLGYRNLVRKPLERRWLERLISDSHSNDYEDDCLLGCCAM